MSERRTMAGPAIAALAALLLLGGCKGAEREPEPTPTPTATAEPEGTIFRDDLELPEPPLAPLRTRIAFTDGGAKLTEPILADLASVIESPQAESGGPLTLRAHGDAGELSGIEPGEDEETPSMVRGEAVKAFLIENGIAEERITVIDFGAQNPLQPNLMPDGTPNEAGRAANRRVDIHIAVPADEATPAPEPTGERKTLAEDVAEGE